MASEIHLDRSARPSRFARADIRVKLLSCFAYVIGVVLSPPGWWWLFGVEATLLGCVVVMARVSPATLISRWLGVVALVGLIAIAVGGSHPRRAELGAATIIATILIKNILAFTALLTLSMVTSQSAILRGLGQLGLPAPIVTTLQFMHRSVFILKDELERMTRARRARSFARSRSLGWGSLAGLLGHLFLRSFERSERVHSAMVARGWDGTIRDLDGSDER